MGWGAWNYPVDRNWTQLNQTDVANYVDGLSPVPAQNMTGQASYSEGGNSFIGASNRGSVTNVDAGFDISFDTGIIRNGTLRVDVDDTSINNDDHTWSLNFAGTFANGMVDLNTITNAQVIRSDNEISAVTAVLGGIFAGTDAEKFLGGFDLLDAADNNSVQGLYTLEKGPLIDAP
ncbi:MAG: hypothetical protein A3H44_04555 [Gammaproteobacteria bacterium RIFCSPLOWO2_02_FULL_57_10]|nr:MAG: hypothetical protein A3H44_04555 [Gammaproteobacteria bacterium RIFCSPLOWO2_02_FULL_57_10]